MNKNLNKFEKGIIDCLKILNIYENKQFDMLSLDNVIDKIFPNFNFLNDIENIKDKLTRFIEDRNKKFKEKYEDEIKKLIDDDESQSQFEYKLKRIYISSDNFENYYESLSKLFDEIQDLKDVDKEELKFNAKNKYIALKFYELMFRVGIYRLSENKISFIRNLLDNQEGEYPINPPSDIVINILIKNINDNKFKNFNYGSEYAIILLIKNYAINNNELNCYINSRSKFLALENLQSGKWFCENLMAECKKIKEKTELLDKLFPNVDAKEILDEIIKILEKFPVDVTLKYINTL